MKQILLFCLIGLTTLSCRIQDHINPTDTCQLAQIAADGTTDDLTYDATGNLIQWVYTSDLQGGSKYAITYVFTNDATGRVSTRLMTIAIDGKALVKPATTQYTYTNGLLTSANTVYNLANSTTRTVNTTYTYDSNQRIIKAVSIETGLTQTSTYEYDSRGNCTRYSYTNTNGSEEERVFTYDTSKNPEQLLIKSIPFNPLTGLPFSVNAVLTSTEIYDDPTGPVTYISKQTDLKTDARGYVTSVTLTYDDGYVGITTYSLTGCQ